MNKLKRFFIRTIVPFLYNRFLSKLQPKDQPWHSETENDAYVNTPGNVIVRDDAYAGKTTTLPKETLG